MTVNLIVLGRLKEKYLEAAISEYAKRISAFAKLNITELDPVKLPENAGDTLIENALASEGAAILRKIPPQSAVTAMCIEGGQLSSEQLAQYISDETARGKSSLTFIIGSSYGLSDEVKNAAGKKLSMSKMTFPHQLARVMLLEQIYRALTIINNRKYHK